ncbi:MAG: phage tail protein [Gammaproteobacteria bacterium]|nr:phage tail protein [Gammaproteobacteria bacterium]
MMDIPVVFHFKVEFGPNSHDGSGSFSEQKDNRFQEVSGLTAEITTEEFKEGGLNEYAHKLPTAAKYGNLSLKRGYIVDSKVGKWIRNAVENFKFEPREITVSLLDEESNPLSEWVFSGAYPVKWSLADLKAQENALSIESMELVYKSFRKV